MDGAADYPDMRLRSGSANKPDAVDLSHHLSLLAKSRLSSPLKVSTLSRALSDSPAALDADDGR